MGAVATFNYTNWLARYPEFTSTVSEPLAELYFTEAGLYLDNTGNGPVSDTTMQTLLMNMLTAHIAQLNLISNGQAQSQLVGRISNASEGSVSVATAWNSSGQPNEEWYTQTKYGASFWTATAQYRMFRYYPGPQRFSQSQGVLGFPWNSRFRV